MASIKGREASFNNLVDGPWVLGEAEERRHLKYARRIVVKVGTPVVTHADGGIAIGRISGIVEQIVHLMHRGKEVVLVTSGAIGHGLLRMQAQQLLSSSLREHLSGQVDRDVDLKAAAAVGQSGLMSMYDMLFREYNMTCAQILVTDSDWKDASSLSQLRHTAAELLHIGAIPIVNENDVISMRKLPVIGKENRILWDNDEIASLLASALHADVLLVLADVARLHRIGSDGLPKPMPVFLPNAQLWHHEDGAERNPTPTVPGTAASPALPGSVLMPYVSRLAREGMDIMVSAACEAISHGVRTAIIVSGIEPANVSKVLAGENIGTIFLKQ
mmetsp:Transcript_20474/g.64665  ORF Transcript_20474/g.64665 Transcript_20474/m.64665 type:complete len:331 (-) Transcript_20474:346-1338(-)